MTDGPNSIDGNQDWVDVHDDGTPQASIAGSSFSIGMPDTSEFAQSGPVWYTYPRIFPDGTLLAVRGDPVAEGDLWTAGSITNAELDLLDTATGEGTTIYRQKHDVSLGGMPAFMPSADCSRGVVVDVDPKPQYSDFDHD